MTSSGKKRLFVLDTNVLIHDPSAIFRFHEHDVHLPMVVLEELDALKKGTSDTAQNARQASRLLDEVLDDADQAAIANGIEMPGPGNSADAGKHCGRLYFQTGNLALDLPQGLPGSKPDNAILALAISLQKRDSSSDVTLVSKDINLRIKARLTGIRAEDYYNDKVLDDPDLLYTGLTEIDDTIWGNDADATSCWQESGHTFYTLKSPATDSWYINQCLYLDGNNGIEAIVRNRSEDTATIEIVRDYRNTARSVWGITARNREQNFALNLLMDPEVDFVSLLGVAGTGKTLLALASGLAQTLDAKIYKEIIVTRVTVSVAEDIGFLPGTEEEKMTPWMGALMDNLEFLADSSEGGEWGRAATNDLLHKRIKIRALNFMRGRTFLNRYVIIDEAQNMTAKQMKTLITRAGPGTKLVCLGNIGQIDTPYLTETTSGLTFVVDRFKDWPHSGHITLRRGERSRLADHASKIL